MKPVDGAIDEARAWRQRRADPDYVADWRAHAGPPVEEAAPFPLRRQTAADLEAGRWKLLAWQDPRLPARSTPFRADVPMIEARVVDPAKDGGDSLSYIARNSGAAFAGLRLLDGALIVKVSRDGWAEQIRAKDAEAFDPERSGLDILIPLDRIPPSGIVRVASLYAISTPRQRP